MYKYLNVLNSGTVTKYLHLVTTHLCMLYRC